MEEGEGDERFVGEDEVSVGEGEGAESGWPEGEDVVQGEESYEREEADEAQEEGVSYGGQEEDEEGVSYGGQEEDVSYGGQEEDEEGVSYGGEAREEEEEEEDVQSMSSLERMRMEVEREEGEEEGDVMGSQEDEDSYANMEEVEEYAYEMVRVLQGARIVGEGFPVGFAIWGSCL